MFDYAPSWYKKKTNSQVQLVSDLARLELAKVFLSKGVDRVIWVDADVLIFNLSDFIIDTNKKYAFCHEIWLSKITDGSIYCWPQVNNAVLTFTSKARLILLFYICLTKLIVRIYPGPVPLVTVGTRLLTKLSKVTRLPLITNVGLFSPLVMRDIAADGGSCIESYMRKFGFPIYAANLCASFRNVDHDGVTMSDGLYNGVVDRLLQTKGGIVNQFCPYHRVN